MNKIPSELIRSLEKQSKTIVRISEVTNEPLDFGNDEFYSTECTVQVQFFYAEDFPINLEDFEIRVMKWFNHNKWTVSASKPHYLDPDTNQSIKVFYFTKIKYI